MPVHSAGLSAVMRLVGMSFTFPRTLRRDSSSTTHPCGAAYKSANTLSIRAVESSTTLFSWRGRRSARDFARPG